MQQGYIYSPGEKGNFEKEGKNGGKGKTRKKREEKRKKGIKEEKREEKRKKGKSSEKRENILILFPCLI